jgi:hypothetical protein
VSPEQGDQIGRQPLGVRPRRVAAALLDQAFAPQRDAAGGGSRVEGQEHH